MANPGIPTSASHDKSMESLLNEFNNILVTLQRTANEQRLAMAAGAVGDDIIKTVWDRFAVAEDRLLQIRRAPDFHDQYARYRGLAYTFNCTDDINAATDKIINLPTNHRFKTDTRVDFIIIEGSLPGGLSENTNYWIRSVDAAGGTVTVTTTEGGGTNINLSNGTGMAEMLLNMKPDLSTLFTEIDEVLDEIELNLGQRATTYDRANLEHDYSTRSTVDTSTLRDRLLDVENLIDVTAA